MSSEKFEDLEDDFKCIKQGISKKIEYELSKVIGESKKSVLREIERGFDELESLLRELESEARNAPNPYRIQMNHRIKQYRQDVDQMKKSVAKIQQGSLAGASSSRNELLSGGSSGITRPPADIAKGRLIQVNDTLNRTSESLARTHRVAAETDQIGVDIVEELGTQREALIRTKERLMDADENLSRSRRILRSMYRRVITNKIILIIIILLELVILGGVVYLKFFKPKK